MQSYVTDLVENHPRSKSRYLAALNIKKALPEIATESHVPTFVKNHKIHAGPFIWLAREGKFFEELFRAFYRNFSIFF